MSVFQIAISRRTALAASTMRLALHARSPSALCAALCALRRQGRALAIAAALVLAGGADAARAACDPAAADDVTATCTGTTTDQGAGAPGTSADPDGFGYGRSSMLHLGVHVLPGATINASFLGVTAWFPDVTNEGTIAGGYVGVHAVSDAHVNNSGTITGGSYGVIGNDAATIVNSGSIFGGINGIITNNGGQVRITNSGIIGGGFQGLNVLSATLNNSGTVAGGIGAVFGGAADITNSGSIIGYWGPALMLSSYADTLTLLRGSRIVGAIQFQGGGDTLNFRGGNHNLSFDDLSGVAVASTTPFAVSGAQAAVIDPSLFALADRNLLDFSRGISGLLESRGGGGAGASAGAIGYAPEAGTAALRIEAAFAGQPALGYADNGAAILGKAPAIATAESGALWARGFAGQRMQPGDAVLAGSTNDISGGAVGIDGMIRPDLRLGGFLGGGATRSRLAYNLGTSDSDSLFAGVYGSWMMGASFLDFALQAGTLSNSSNRIINNNLAANGLEVAAARFDGWYASPELSLGHRFTFGSGYALTPVVRARFLVAGLDGYTETGTTAPLTVAARSLGNSEERAELKLSHVQMFESGASLTWTLTGGALGSQRLGDANVGGTLLGQGLSMPTQGDAAIAGGYGAIGIDWRARQFSLFADAEMMQMSDTSTLVAGKGGFRLAF